MTDQEVAELSRMAGTDFTGFARTNRVSMDETLCWFDRYLGEHPEVELVYRRHPSEWNSPSGRTGKKRPNFHVIFGGRREGMDRGGGLHLHLDEHRHCRGVHGGKNRHILRPVPIEHEYDPVTYKDARYITTYADFAPPCSRTTRGSHWRSELLRAPATQAPPHGPLLEDV